MNIAKRIDFSSCNHGRSLRMIVNGNMVDMEQKSSYVGLLAFIKFLGIKIEEYYQGLYKAKILDLKYPTVTEYLNAILNNIWEYIDLCIKENREPTPVGLLASIGENRNEIEYFYSLLHAVIDYTLYELHYKISSDGYNKTLEHIEREENLLVKADNLYALLDVSKEDVRERIDEVNKGSGYKIINLEKELSRKSNKSKK